MDGRRGSIGPRSGPYSISPTIEARRACMWEKLLKFPPLDMEEEDLILVALWCEILFIAADVAAEGCLCCYYCRSGKQSLPLLP